MSGSPRLTDHYNELHSAAVVLLNVMLVITTSSLYEICDVIRNDVLLQSRLLLISLELYTYSKQEFLEKFISLSFLQIFHSTCIARLLFETLNINTCSRVIVLPVLNLHKIESLTLKEKYRCRVFKKDTCTYGLRSSERTVKITY